MLRNGLALFVVVSLVTACFEVGAGDASPDSQPNEATDFGDFEDEFGADEIRSVPDPLRLLNRSMFTFNDKLYFWVIKPTAKGYGKVVPEAGRLAIGRCLDNLGFPARFVNNALQGKLREAGVECARFGVNTTAGILGLFDVADERLGLTASPEDFGQTLGSYGFGDGFVLVLPVLGPSNLRDALGLVPDYFLDPVNYIEAAGIRLSINAGEAVNHVSLHLGEYENLKKAALDPYIFITDAYKQNRDKKMEE